jgi:8-oxo-dGTP pyrophosphatase MutT (NUDIX family)
MARRDHLRALLDAHPPADDREAVFVDRVRRLLEVPGDPFSRHHFTPGHVTASCFVLSPERDALLLVFHGKLHRWLQPGGHVDPGDADVIAAARREAAEEVGLPELRLADGERLLDVDVHDIPALKGEPPHAHFDVRLLFVAPHRRFRAGSDARDARWVPLDQVRLEESDESVMRAVRKLR